MYKADAINMLKEFIKDNQSHFDNTNDSYFLGKVTGYKMALDLLNTLTPEPEAAEDKQIADSMRDYCKCAQSGALEM